MPCVKQTHMTLSGRSFLSLVTLLLLPGCGAGASGENRARSAVSFSRLSEEDRFLAASALKTSVTDRGERIAVKEWLPVYLDEASPRVAGQLERALETELGGPIVLRLMREARAATSLSEKAALRLLSDGREAVRLCGIRALGFQGSSGAVARLESLFLDEGEDDEARLAAAEGLVASGHAGPLRDWCDARGLFRSEVPVSSAGPDEIERLEPLARGVLSALGHDQKPSSVSRATGNVPGSSKGGGETW